MKRIISAAMAAGLFAGAFSLPATLRAEGAPEGGEQARGEKGGKEAFASRMREKLGISEEQEDKLKAARRVKRDASAAAFAELAAATRTLQDQLEDKASEADLAATLDKIAAARKTMRAAEEAFEASLSSILTPTQRAKMAVAMKEHGGDMRGRGRTGGGMRGGKHVEEGGDERPDVEHHDGPEHGGDD